MTGSRMEGANRSECGGGHPTGARNVVVIEVVTYGILVAKWGT